MLNVQNKFLKYLSDIEAELSKINFSEGSKEIFSLNELKTAINDTELIIPVIGAFSAGKSSLINSFLGTNYLPVGLTPETSLAAELRYSEDERIEAVLLDGNTETFQLTDVKAISNDAKKYNCLKIFINNAQVKAIEPLVLVDMPGFESPNDQHNKAIMQYLSTGVSYIVLISITDGTVTRSLMRKLIDINELDKSFHIVLSKTNLKSDEEIREVKEIISEQITDALDCEYNISLADNNGGKSLKNVLNLIDREQLFHSLFVNILKDNFDSIIENIDTMLSTLKNSKKDNEKTVETLKASIDKLIEKREKLLQDVKDEYFEIGYIVDNVGIALNNHIDELAGAVVNKQDMDSLVNDIIKTSLIKSLKTVISQSGTKIIDSFSAELSRVVQITSGFDTSKITNTVTEQVKRLFEHSSSMLNALDGTKIKNTESSLFNIIYIIAKLALLLAPELIEKFVNSKEKQRVAIADKIKHEIIPDIKAKIRASLPELIKEFINKTVNVIADDFENLITEQQVLISENMEVCEERASGISSTITVYETAKTNIKTLAEKALY